MTTKTFSPRLSTPTGYTPTRLSVLKALDRIDCDLYVVDDDGKPVLFRATGIVIERDDFARLEQRNVKHLFVKNRDSDILQKQLRSSMESVLQNDRMAEEDRFGFLQKAVSHEIEHAFRMINSHAAVTRSLEIGQKISALLQGGQTLPSDLFQVVEHDYYTFTHLTNVAGYAVLLAEKLGITDSADLDAIAIGGLLHDLGKRLIEPTILNKPGRLTDREWDVIKTHPQKGFEELRGRDDLNAGQLMMVYQHHEKLDGGGYPVGIVGDDIHPWARLCAIVDIFDAMTCARPYRKAMELSVVLGHIGEMAGRQLDKEMVECWISAMTPQT